MFKLTSFIIILLWVVGLAGIEPLAQTKTTVIDPWSGWVQCQVLVRGDGYSHHETQTWTITGPPNVQGNVEEYPTAWAVSGQGSMQREIRGTTQAAQWSVSGAPMNGSIGVTRHLDRLTVQLWSVQRPARGGLTGVETVSANGTQRPSAIIRDVDPWRWSTIEGALTATQIAGSASVPFDGARAPLAPAGLLGNAACSWQLARGSTPIPPPTVTSAAATASMISAPTLRSASSVGAIAPSPTQTASIDAVRDATPSADAVSLASQLVRTQTATTADAIQRERSVSTGVAGASTASTAGVTASMSGPATLTTGSRGTFDVSVVVVPTSVGGAVISGVTLTFDSNEGEMASVTMPAPPKSSASLSATFTFEAAGTYTVSARGSATRTLSIIENIPQYEDRVVYNETCKCNVTVRVMLGYKQVTSYQTDTYPFTVQRPVTVAAP